MILTCFFLIFKKLIHQRVTNFFKKESCLGYSQYGLRYNLSTTYAVLNVLTTAYAYDQINDKKYTGLILLDFKKGFDSICHNILSSKIEHYGIRGVGQKLISCFLSDRHQKIFEHIKPYVPKYLLIFLKYPRTVI